MRIVFFLAINLFLYSCVQETPEITELEFGEINNTLINDICDNSLKVASVSSRYQRSCAGCHGEDAKGKSIYPKIDFQNLDKKSFEEIVRQGKGSMPSFPENLYSQELLLSDYDFFFQKEFCKDDSKDDSQVIVDDGNKDEPVDDNIGNLDDIVLEVDNSIAGDYQFNIIYTDTKEIVSLGKVNKLLKNRPFNIFLVNNSSNDVVRSIFKLEGLSDRTENLAPYALCGDDAGDPVSYNDCIDTLSLDTENLDKKLTIEVYGENGILSTIADIRITYKDVEILPSVSFSEIKTVLNSKCITCHQAGKEASFANFNFDTEAEFFGSVWFNARDLSSLALVRSKGHEGNIANMPPNGSDEAKTYTLNDYLKIKSWILNTTYTAPIVVGNGNSTFDTLKDPVAQFDCDQVNIHEKENLKLTKSQYENTLKDLFGTDIFNDISADLALITESSSAGDLKRSELKSMGVGEYVSYSKMAEKVAAKIITNVTLREKVFGVCADSADGSKFVRTVRVHTEFSRANEILQAKCVNCHSGLNLANESDYFNSKYFKAGDANSLGLKRTKGYGASNSNMPKGLGFPIEEYNALKTWVVNYSGGNASKDPILTLSEEDCIEDYLENFAAKVLRKPLNDEEKGIARAVYSGSETPIKGLENVLSFHLQSPSFLVRLELGKDELDNSGNIVLTPFELASQISYELVGTTPDDILLSFAQDGSIEDLNIAKEQAQRLVEVSESSRDRFKEFFYHWLRLKKELNTNFLGSEIIGGIQDVDGFKEASILETNKFIDDLIVNNRSFASILTSTKSYASQGDLAKVYGHAPVSGSGSATMNGRMGLIGRVPYLHSDLGRTELVRRSVSFRNSVLCLDIPNPPDDIFDLRADFELLEADAVQLNNREYIDVFTGDPVCMSCHRVINPTGSLFEGFDSVGAKREQEHIYNYTGEFVRNLDISTVAEIELWDNQTVKVDNINELLLYLGNSASAKACFSKKLYEYMNYGDNPNQNTCRTNEVYQNLNPNDGVLDAYISSVINSSFKLRKMNSN